jgi:hypothetical protein
MRRRLPESRSILQVYAVIAVLFAAWTIPAFLWKLSAWLLILSLGEVFTLFSYAMAANFLESLVVLIVLLMAAALLPARSLRDDFAVRGTILSIGLIGASMAFVESHMQFGLAAGWTLLVAPAVLLLATAALLAFSSSTHWLRATALWLSDRVLVFLFLLLPLFSILSVYVIVRNLA